MAPDKPARLEQSPGVEPTRRKLVVASYNWAKSAELQALLADLPVCRLLVAAGKASSRSDANRLVSQGAVSIDGRKFDDANETVSAAAKGSVIKVGKRGYFKIK